MTRSIVRLAGWLVAMLVSLLTGASALHPTAAVAAAATPPALSYAYGGHHLDAVLTYTTADLGPPMSYDLGNTFDAVDRWSHRAPGRLKSLQPPRHTTTTAPRGLRRSHVVSTPRSRLVATGWVLSLSGGLMLPQRQQTTSFRSGPARRRRGLS